MGTRSIVAVPTVDGHWKGRYVHWDGYPAGVGDAVRNIIRRDGYAKAVKVLTEDHYGWSSVDGAEAQVLSSGHDDGRFVAVPGYGVAYTTKAGSNGIPQSRPDDWLTEADLADSWCEYVHLMTPDGVVSYEIRDGKLRDTTNDRADATA